MPWLQSKLPEPHSLHLTPLEQSKLLDPHLEQLTPLLHSRLDPQLEHLTPLLQLRLPLPHSLQVTFACSAVEKRKKTMTKKCFLKSITLISFLIGN